MKGSNKLVLLCIFISAAMVIAGVFLPLTRIPLYGDLTYNRISPYESYVVILFAILGPVLILVKKHRLLFLAPIGIWVTLLFPVIESYLKPEKTGFLGKMGDKVTSAMQDQVVNLLLDILELSWGGYLFIAGLLLFTISSVLRSIK